MLFGKSPGGLPVGYLITHIEFGNLKNLINPSLWSSAVTCPTTSRVRTIQHFLFACFGALLTMLVSLMGAAAAVLLIPTLQVRGFWQNERHLSCCALQICIARSLLTLIDSGSKPRRYHSKDLIRWPWPIYLLVCTFTEILTLHATSLLANIPEVGKDVTLENLIFWTKDLRKRRTLTTIWSRR